MKLLKNLFIVFVLVILITAVVLWVLAKSIKPEVIKNYVSAQLSALTHQDSRIEGRISWQIFPHPGIKITKIQIGNPSTSPTYSARVENLFFNLKIRPLLNGKLIFNELNVDGFKITLNSIPNSSSPTPNYIPSTQVSKKANLTKQFAIERFLLSHGQIKILKNLQAITLSNLQIGAEQFNLQQNPFPFQFRANLTLLDANSPLLKAQVNFKGSTKLPPALFSNFLAALQNTPLEGQLTLEAIKIKQLEINKLSAHAKAKAGILLLNPLTLSLYDGVSVGDLNYDFTGQKLTINQTATKIDSYKLLYNLFKKTLFKGKLNFSIHAQTSMQKDNWQENTTGNGSLTIENGLIGFIDLSQIIKETTDKINKLFADQKVPQETSLASQAFNKVLPFQGNTNFNLLTLQYELENAQLETNSLVLQTDKLQLKGEASLNLTNSTLQGSLFAKLLLENPEIDKIQDLLQGNFPLLVSGTLTEPKVLPDLQKINPILSRHWLKTKLTKPIKKIGKTFQTILKTRSNTL